MKTKTILAVLAAALAGVIEAKPLPQPELITVPERSWQIYPSESNANIRITVTTKGAIATNGTVTVKVSNDGGKEVLDFAKYDLSKGNPVTYTLKVEKPCFALVDVALQESRCRNRLKLGFDIEKIKPAVPEPEDFDAWWAEQFAEQAKIADPVTLKPISNKAWSDKYDYFCVRAKTITADGCSYGILSVPKKKTGKFGCIAITQCVGPGYSEPDPNYAREDMMTLALNVHPWDPTAPDYQEVYKRENEKCPKKAYMFRGMESRENYHYRNAILGCKTLIDYIRARPDFSGELFYIGGSQGGGFGLILGGIFKDAFRAISVQMPAMCDFGGYTIGRRSGWPYPGDVNDKLHPDDRAAALVRFGYFDGVNWAKRIKSPILFTIGMMDDCCPVSGTIAAYNSVPRSTPKFIQLGKDWTHSTGWLPAHMSYGFLQNFMAPEHLTPYRYWWTWK
ncbi:MAG: acetylxylan esterase [Kiritimatiellae bacterium]|nr:acetylxylan esterase [Kiritimatiellia bacterium]